MTVGVAVWSLLLPLVFAWEGAAAAAPGPDVQEAREVRTVWTAEFGVPHPAGVTYLPSSGQLLVAEDGEGPTSVLRLGFDEDAQGTFSLPELSNPATLAADDAADRLTGIDGDALISAADQNLDTKRPPTSEADIASLGLKDPQGAAFDATTGTWFVLDAGTQSIARVRMPGGDPGMATRIPLGDLRAPRLQGLAIDPSDGLLYVGSPDEDLIYAVDRSGDVQKIFSTASLELSDPQAMTFAPSSDTSDDPATTNLFIADAGGPSTVNRTSADAADASSGGIAEVTLAAEVALIAEDATASLIQVIQTSQFIPGSPDPSGITYLSAPPPGRDRLLIVDSEVDETTGAGYHGVNMWELTRNGEVTGTGTTLGFTNEPTGVGHDPATNTLFISADDGNRIFIVRTGADGGFGTGDDVVTSIDLGPLGVTDAEDPEFDPSTGHLFFLDGVSTEVYEVDPVDGIFGNANDMVTHFDVSLGGAVTDAEALTSDQAAGTLLVGNRTSRKIYEITKTGSLVRMIDASGVSGLINVSGLALAPASNGSGNNLWIVDRAVDNGPNPNENDGKIFEITTGTTGNAAPVVTSATIDQATPKTNDTLTVSVVASDPDGDPVTLSYQWRKNGVAIPGETGPTLDLSLAGNGDKGDGISVRVTASDGPAQGFLTSGQITVINTFPSFGQDLGDRGGQEGQAVSVSAAASDADQDDLYYEAAELPPGVTIDPATGLISGTIATGASSNSPYPVSVTVRDYGDPPPPTPIALVQQAFGDQTATPGNTISVSFPAAPTADNLLVAFGNASSNRTPTIPVGWTLALESGGSAETVVFYKIAGPGEPSTVTYSVNGSDVFMSLAIFEYEGLHDVQAQVLDRTSFGSASNATSVSTGITQPTVDPDELLLASVSLNASRTFQNTWTNGFTRLVAQRRQSIAQRVVSSINQFETTESWLNSVGTAAGVLVTFRSPPDPVTDPNPGSATDTFTWTVTPSGPNTPPVIDSVTISPTPPKTNDTVTATVEAHDDEGHPLSFTYQWAKNGTDLPGQTSATLDLSAVGNGDMGDEISVTVTASDGLDPSAPASSGPVAVANSDPSFDQDLGDRAGVVGEVVSLSAAASDPDGDALTYAAAGLPPGLAVDTATGLITGTIDAVASTTPFTVEVRVGDGPDVDAVDAFTWTIAVNTAPAIDSVAIDQGAPTTIDTLSASVSAHDDEGDPLTFQYQWAKNGADLPGATSASLDLSVTGNGDRGDSISVTVTASDGPASSAAVTSPSVTVVNAEPAFDQDLGDRTSLVGEVVSLSAAASDPDGDALTYAATGLPPGLSIDPSTGLISGQIDAAASSTPYSVAVTVGDGPDVDATDTFAWTVNVRPLMPTGLATSLTSVSVNLDWADNAEADLAGYRVYRGTSAVGPFFQLNANLITTSNYTDTTAPSSATSYYRVTAVDTAALESAPAEVGATRGISFLSSSTATGRDVTALTVSRPSGVASGDLLLAAVTVSRIPTVTAPSGWTLIRNTTNGTSMRQVLYYRVVGSSEPTSYRWTFSAGNGAAAVISAYRGVDPTAPIGTSSGQANGSSTAITAPSVATTIGNMAVTGFFGIAINASVTPPSGMIEHAEAIVSSGGRRVSVENSDLLLPEVGSSGARIATASRPAVSIGQLVTLRPIGA